MQVLVRDNNVEQALRVLKKKMQREGVFREMKRARFHEKPSEKKLAKNLKPFVALASWLGNKRSVRV
jgi:small subunit ribosomal protein S21